MADADVVLGPFGQNFCPICSPPNPHQTGGGTSAKRGTWPSAQNEGPKLQSDGRLNLGWYLEEVDVAVGVAEAEHVLFLGVLGNGLDHAVLGQQAVAGGQLLLRGASAVGLVEEQRTTCMEERGEE